MLKLAAIFLYFICFQSGCVQHQGPITDIGDGVSSDTTRMGRYLAETRALASAGKFKEALQHQIWFHNHVLEYDSNYGGVRLSFALSDWIKLGEQYPPALDSLIKIRDENSHTIVEGKGDVEMVGEVMSINRELGENKGTISLYEVIDEKYPVLADSSLKYVIRLLLDAKRYNLIKKYLPDPLVQYQKEESLHQEIISNVDKEFLNDKEFRKLNRSLSDESFRKTTSQLVDYCKAINDEGSAKKIQSRVDSIMKSSNR